MDRLANNYFMLLLLAFIWGSSFILMKKGLVAFDSMQVASLRIIIAFIFLTPFLPRAIKLLKRRHYLPVLIAALIGNGMPAFLFAEAQTKLDSALVGILNSIVPLFTFFIAFFFFRIKVSKANFLGIILGFLGVLFLGFKVFPQQFELNKYVLLVVLATFFYAISINVIKRDLQELSASSITALAFLIIAPFATIIIFQSRFLYILETHPYAYQSLAYIAILAIFGTAIAVMIFNKLLSSSSVLFTSSITYLIPIVAIFWGIFDGEFITSYHILGFVIILSGVYLVNKPSD